LLSQDDRRDFEAIVKLPHSLGQATTHSLLLSAPDFAAAYKHTILNTI